MKHVYKWSVLNVPFNLTKQAVNGWPGGAQLFVPQAEILDDQAIQVELWTIAAIASVQFKDRDAEVACSKMSNSQLHHLQRLPEALLN